jgi:hypothetical protein
LEQFDFLDQIYSSVLRSGINPAHWTASALLRAQSLNGYGELPPDELEKMQVKSDEADLKWEAEETSMLPDLASMLNNGGYNKLKEEKHVNI